MSEAADVRWHHGEMSVHCIPLLVEPSSSSEDAEQQVPVFRPLRS